MSATIDVLYPEKRKRVLMIASKPPAAARTFFSAAGMAACGCHARSRKKLLRTAAGSEET